MRCIELHVLGGAVNRTAGELRARLRTQWAFYKVGLGTSAAKDRERDRTGGIAPAATIGSNNPPQTTAISG